MLFNTSFLMILLAGIMNGSFVVPTKHLSNKSSEKIWRYHSVIGLFILPWLILFAMAPNEFTDYARLPQNILALILFGGVLFGIGQICFSYAIASIGMGLSFATNLGIGVVIGSMFTVGYQHLLFTLQGGLVSLAVLLILCGLAIYYFSSKEQKNPFSYSKRLNHTKGWLLAVFAGITSGFQNVVFIMANNTQQHLFLHTGSFWIWPPFLTAAAIIMFLSFSYKIKNNISNTYNQVTFKAKEWFAILVMGLFFTGSLVLYSKGAESLGQQQIIIAWPAFMVSIILTTQFWGKVFQESSGIQNRKLRLKWCSILLMIIAIVILAIELHQ